MSFNVLPQKQTGRRIVYLDQNVVSELARLRLGRTQTCDRKDALEALAHALDTAISTRQTARCVESWFHLWESSSLLGAERQDARALFDEIWRFLLTHSWRLQFDSVDRVREFQTLVTVASETGVLDYAREFLWRGAFSSDPNEPNEAAGVEFAGHVFAIGVPWRPMVRSRLLGWASKVEVARQAGRYATFANALSELRQETRELALESDCRRAWAYSWGMGSPRLSAAAVRRFIESDAYVRLPVNDILIRVAARVLSDHNRALKDSDATDFEIMALAIPYCDIVVTDNHMASVVKGLNLDTKYDTRVFPATSAGLRSAAATLDTLT